MKIVRIDLIDMAYNSDTWKRHELHLFKPVHLSSVGFLIEEREDCYIISKDYQPDEDTFRHLSAIPKVIVTKITTLRNK